jgi:hypothetical protein
MARRKFLNSERRRNELPVARIRPTLVGALAPSLQHMFQAAREPRNAFVSVERGHRYLQRPRHRYCLLAGRRLRPSVRHG